MQAIDLRQALGLAIVLLITTATGGCASSGSSGQSDPVAPEAEADPYPEWVRTPAAGLEGRKGIATSSCSEIHGNNYSLAQKETIANARQLMASQIQTRVRALDRAMERTTKTSAGTSFGGSFDSVSNSLVEQELLGATPVTFERVEDNDTTMLCTLLVMDEASSTTVFDTAVSRHGNLPPDHKEVLLERFLADEAQQALEAELDDLE